MTPDGTVVIPASDFPPDTNGAVGPNHVVEINKKELRIYNKSGQLGFVTLLDDFWNSVLPSPVQGVVRTDSNGNLTGQNKSFDPRILYDEGMQRWVAVSMSSEHRFDETNKLLVAVSNTSNPQGTWIANAFTADPLSNSNNPLSSQYWGDFPRLGVSEEGITVATTLFDLMGDNNAGLQNIYTFSKDEIVNNNHVVVASSAFHLDDTQAPDFAQPVVDLNLVAPSGGPLAVPDLPGIGPLKPIGQSLIGLGPSGGVPQRVDIVNGVPGPLQSISPTLFGSSPPTVPSKGLTLGSPISVNVGPFGQPVIEGSVIFKNGYFWAVRDKFDNSFPTDSNVIEWMKIDPLTNTVESGYIKDDNSNASAQRDYYYPSIAVNDKGYVFIGFNGSSAEDYIGAFGVVGETVNGKVSFGGVFTIKAGEAPYERWDRLDRNRWGDYSATVVDPTEDGVFWTFQEYAFLNEGGIFGNVIPNSYATRIAAYGVSELIKSAVDETYTLIGIKQSASLDEAEFEFAKQVRQVNIGGRTLAVDGQSIRLPLDGTAGPDGLFDLAYQGDALNYLVNTQGYLDGERMPDALAGVGVPPVLRFDPATGESFAEFFNPYDFFLQVDDVQLYVNSDMRNLNLLDFAIPSGDLVDGIPPSFILWPDQTFRLSFGDLALDPASYALALAEYSRLDEPDVTYRVAAAGVLGMRVPEPVTATLGLMGLGVLGMATRRRTAFNHHTWRSS